MMSIAASSIEGSDNVTHSHTQRTSYYTAPTTRGDSVGGSSVRGRHSAPISISDDDDDPSSASSESGSTNAASPSPSVHNLRHSEISAPALAPAPALQRAPNLFVDDMQKAKEAVESDLYPNLSKENPAARRSRSLKRSLDDAESDRDESQRSKEVKKAKFLNPQSSHVDGEKHVSPSRENDTQSKTSRDDGSKSSSSSSQSLTRDAGPTLSGKAPGIQHSPAEEEHEDPALVSEKGNQTKQPHTTSADEIIPPPSADYFASLPTYLNAPVIVGDATRLPSQITPFLRDVREAATTPFTVAFSTREIEPLERGRWVIDTAPWRLVRQQQFWEHLQRLVRHRRLGWAISIFRFAPRDHASLGIVEVWCFGEVVQHVYFALWAASLGNVSWRGVEWKDAKGITVIKMATEKPKRPRRQEQRLDEGKGKGKAKAT